MLNKRSLCCRKYDTDVSSGLSDSDSVFGLSCFLLLKCNFLPKIFRTLPRKWYLNFNVVDLHFSSFVRTLVAQNFRRLGGVFKPTFSVLFLKLHIIFWSCTSEAENRSTSSAKRKFVRQSDSWSPSRILMPFDVCQRSTSSFNAMWSTVLKSTLDRGSPLYLKHVTFFVSWNWPFLFRVLSPQEAYVVWFDSAKIKRCPKKTGDLLSQMPSCSPLSRPTFWYPTRGISVTTICVLQDDPAFALNV